MLSDLTIAIQNYTKEMNEENLNAVGTVLQQFCDLGMAIYVLGKETPQGLVMKTENSHGGEYLAVFSEPEEGNGPHGFKLFRMQTKPVLEEVIFNESLAGIVLNPFRNQVYIKKAMLADRMLSK
ncbi:MAG: hypothetical protein K6F52_05095 [Clostridia bacterium]|nr:hypothetical protein [Clostridia bacterium]